MNVPQVLLCLMVATTTTTTSVHSKPNLYAFPTYYEQLAAAAAPPPPPLPPRHNLLHSIKSQFHAQDELGQYTYGYNDGLSSKVESKTADGITQGSYAYVDSNGILQNVNYISDDVNGFRVSASNLPVAPGYQYPVVRDDAAAVMAHENPTQSILAVSTADVKASPEPLQTESIKTTETVESVKVSEKQNQTEAAANVAVSTLANTSPTAAAVFPTYSTYQPFTHFSWYPQPALAPMPLTSFRYQPVAQVAPVAPMAPVYSQFHAQDEFGQYSYGYSGGPSSKVEIKTLDGITRGGYSYVDANGILQKVNYISDPVNGFRVAATNLPISNIATTYYPAEYHLPELNLLSHSDKTKND